MAFSRRAPAFRLLAITVAAWNFAAFIYPHSKPASDPVYAFALRLNEELPAGATIYYRTFSPDDWYLAYFAPGRRWVHLPQTAPLPPACLETTALSDPNYAVLPKQSWSLNDGRHYVRVACY
jgi:hypothetical protein